MSLKKFFCCCGLLFFQFAIADPSYEIMKSCRDGAPLNETITMTKIDDAAEYSTDNESGCEDHYQMSYNGKKFGSIVCQGTTFLIVSGKKFNLSEATDVLQNPEVTPGYLFPHVSSWWKVSQSSTSYLCVASPVAESGKFAAQFMYYIVERAFCPDCANPQAFFYSFKKNSAGPHL